MNKHNIFRFTLIVILFSIQLISIAQEKTFLKVGDHEYGVDEFNYIFNKNNSLSQSPLSKEEYIPLFVNYKLKVLEAIDQGYDTIPSFTQELDYYRNELAKPYLTDKKATEAVVQEAYDHLSSEINAYHILVKLPASPAPEDTLAAYKKISGIRAKITNLESFEKLARSQSDCPSSSRGGNLGYFTGFMMVYPFEKAAYDTEVGHFSDIVRTSFGYHIIYVKDKRPNQGEIKVAHIMKMYPQNAPESVKHEAKATIDSVYRKLMNGEDFNDLVQKYSDDRNSLANNGELPWFSIGRMVPEFAEAAFALTENGQISEPIQTQFGWHIIKRLDHKPMPGLEESREDIMQKINRDERAYAGKKATIARLRAEYDFTEDNNGISKAKSLIFSQAPSVSEITLSKLSEDNIPMASFAGQALHSGNYVAFLKKNKVNLNRFNEKSFEDTWQSFCENALLEYEKSILEEKYPDFRFLMNEYHDGLLIFEISQKEIWNKASEDTTGLQQFFADHKQDYKLNERFEGTLIWSNNKKLVKEINALVAKPDFVLTDSIKKSWSEDVKIEKGAFTKGQYPVLDQQVWNMPKPKGKKAFKYLITLGELKPAAERELNEVRGQVLSDYQSELEKTWIKHLKAKYHPVVDKTVLKGDDQ